MQGESFEGIAEKYSEDKGSAKNGGKLPRFGSGRMVLPFEQAVMALDKPGAFQQEDRFSGNQSGDVDNFIGADLWLHDGSFLRLKEVELAYTIDKKIAKIGDIRLFMRGFNLFTMFSEIADLGLDPEANGYNNFRGSTYSTLKSYTLGVNFNF